MEIVFLAGIFCSTLEIIYFLYKIKESLEKETKKNNFMALHKKDSK